MNKRVILASTSPRRKELLSTIIDDFDIIKPFCEEKDESTPEKTALNNALRKAESIKKNNLDAIVIASDTVVAMDNKIYGKPPTRENAISMLAELQGKWHKVFTGVSVLGEKEYNYYVESDVLLKKLGKKQIENYVDNFSPYDKAGGYGIQDKEITERFEGDYHNIMGLPLSKLRKILRENGIDVKQ